MSEVDGSWLEALVESTAGEGVFTADDGVTEEIEEAARFRLFDTSLSWAASAARAQASAPTVETIEALFGTAGSRQPAPAARILDLAARARATETDDIHLRSCTTPGSAICSVVVALAPLAPHRTASDALRAVAAGYEAMTRAAEALGGPDLLARGTWPSRAVAPVGAAIAAAVALGLDLDESVGAVALAAGWWCDAPLPEPAREMSYAQGVLTGALAAVSARRGMRGSRAALATWERRAGEGGLRDGGQHHRWAVLETSTKPFCGARQTLTATTTLQRIAEDAALAPDDILAIRVALPGMHLRMVDRPEPSTRLDAITSMQYQLALALLRPSDLYDLVRAPSLGGGAAELMARVELAPGADLVDAFPEHWGARVEVVTRDGTITRAADGVEGERALDWSALRHKASKLFDRAGVPEGTLGELESLARGFTSAATLDAIWDLVSPRGGRMTGEK